MDESDDNEKDALSCLVAMICSDLQFLSACFAKAEFPRCVAAPKSERACAAANAVNILRILKAS